MIAAETIRQVRCGQAVNDTWLFAYCMPANGISDRCNDLLAKHPRCPFKLHSVTFGSNAARHTIAALYPAMELPHRPRQQHSASSLLNRDALTYTDLIAYSTIELREAVQFLATHLILNLHQLNARPSQPSIIVELLAKWRDFVASQHVSVGFADSVLKVLVLACWEDVQKVERLKAVVDVKEVRKTMTP